jgi:hypothetical protein
LEATGVTYTWRQLASRACWLAAGSVLVLGAVWLIVSLVRLDSNDPDSGVAAGFIVFIIGGGSVAVALLIGALALRLSADTKGAAPVYLTGFGIACLLFGWALRNEGAPLLGLCLLAVASGGFMLLSQRLTSRSRRLLANGAAFVSAALALITVPLL